MVPKGCSTAASPCSHHFRFGARVHAVERIFVEMTLDRAPLGCGAARFERTTRTIRRGVGNFSFLAMKLLCGQACR
jgi:hypothetical protein